MINANQFSAQMVFLYCHIMLMGVSATVIAKIRPGTITLNSVKHYQPRVVLQLLRLLLSKLLQNVKLMSFLLASTLLPQNASARLMPSGMMPPPSVCPIATWTPSPMGVPPTIKKPAIAKMSSNGTFKKPGASSTVRKSPYRLVSPKEISSVNAVPCLPGTSPP